MLPYEVMAKIPMRFFKVGLVGFVLAGILPAMSHAETLRDPAAFPQVLIPKYKTAEEMAHLLEPFLAPGGSISILDGKLMVKSSLRNVDEVRKVMGGLDHGQEKLRVRFRPRVAGNVPAESLLKSTYVGEAREGELAILSSPSAHILVRPKLVMGGVSLEILTDSESPQLPPKPVALTRGRVGQWIEAGDGFEIQAEVVPE